MVTAVLQLNQLWLEEINVKYIRVIFLTVELTVPESV